MSAPAIRLERASFDKLRLLYITPYFAPSWAYGGPPRISYDMARELVRRGHEATVLTTDCLDDVRRLSADSEIMDGIRVLRTRNLSNWLAWNHKIFVPLGFNTILGASLQGARVAHMFSLRTAQNALAFSALRAARIPYVLSAFGELPRASGVKRPIKLIYDLLFGFQLIRSSATLLAQTAEEVAWYRKFGARKDQVQLLPLAIDLQDLSALPTRGVYREKLGIGPGEILILFLGRIHEYKGTQALIRAFGELSAQHPNLRLVITGRDDGYLGAARAIAAQVAPAGSVLFPGPAYGRERFAAYQDADVFAITPLHPEQTSLAALEACAVGTPVLVTDQAPIPGLEEAQAGIRVQYDVTAIRDGLLRMIGSREIRRRMGEKAAQLVRERFSLESVVSALEQIYFRAADPTVTQASG